MGIVIGITGGIGTGKSLVSKKLRERGYRILDADQLSREVTAVSSPALAELVALFGQGILDAEGALDRKGLASIVFSDTKKKQQMESIITARIVARIREEADAFRENGTGALFLDAPTLYETGADNCCDLVWLIIADTETRIARVMERDHCSREAVLARMHAQMPEEEKRRRAAECIDNSGDPSALDGQIEVLLKKYVPKY